MSGYTDYRMADNLRRFVTGRKTFPFHSGSENIMKRILYGLLFILFTVSAQGQFLEYITVREAKDAAETRARSDFAPDAVLTHALFYGVEHLGIRLNMDKDHGTANGWVYRFYSPHLDEMMWYVSVKVQFVGYQAVRLTLDTMSIDFPVELASTVLTDPWVDSDIALLGSKNGGADTFLQSHPDSHILLAMLMNIEQQQGYVPSGQHWLFRFAASDDTLNCLVHAETGIAYRCLEGNAPTITSLPPSTGRVGERYRYIVVAWGIPAPTFSLTIAPAGMSIDAMSGEIHWIPESGQEGQQHATVEAVNSSGSDTQSFTVSVQAAATAPKITSSPVTEATAGKQYVYQVTASGSPPPQYSLIEHPTGMMIDAGRGGVYWSPTRAHAGTHTVHIRAENAGGSDEQSYPLEVYTTPVIASIPEQRIAPNTAFSYQVLVDARPAPEFSLNAGPSGLTIDSNSGLIQWTPDDTQHGRHVVLFQATNRVGMQQQSFDIEVDDTVPVHEAPPSSWSIDAPWPQPASSVLHIPVRGIYDGELSLDVYDVLGRRVLSTISRISSDKALVSIPVDALVNGVYMLRASIRDRIVKHAIRIAR